MQELAEAGAGAVVAEEGEEVVVVSERLTPPEDLLFAHEEIACASEDSNTHPLHSEHCSEVSETTSEESPVSFIRFIMSETAGEKKRNDRLIATVIYVYCPLKRS